MYRKVPIALLVVAAMLAGCRSGPQSAPAPPTAALSSQAVSLAPTVAAPTTLPTAVPTDTAAPPTNTPVPPTDTPVPPTNTPVPTATTAPTNTPAPTATDVPRATIKTATLNVRSGPGGNYPAVASVKQGNALVVRGQTDQCAFLAVTTAEGEAGWIAGGPDFVTLNTACAAIPKAEAPPTATAPPAPTAAPTAAETATAAAAPAPAAQAPAPAPKAVGGGLSGSLLYSIFNREKDRWELWQYNFASGENKFMKEWRTEAAFSKNYGQVTYFAWPQGAGENAGIYIANPDLSGERLLLPGGAYPSFSPDGGRLAVMAKRIWIVNSDGSGLHPLLEGEYPAWSPVDNWLAHRGCYGPDCGLWLTNVDSGERRRLTTGGGDGQPAWSPDGQQLAYISKDDGNFEVYRVNRDGSNKVRLTNEAHSDGLPVWSPGGDWIAFRSDRGGSWAIYVMRPDGSDVRKIVDADVLPAWFFEKMAWRP